MAVIAMDLGATKLAIAIFGENGSIEHKEIFLLFRRQGKEVGELVGQSLNKLLEVADERELNIEGIGVCVPGIWYRKKGVVWAPNIPGWENYPLLEEMQLALGKRSIPIQIDSDRSCYILGETWLGAAKGSENAIFLAVGTGIGAGIMVDGHIVRGSSDIGGAIGWLALERPFKDIWKSCGCFEYQASGEGIARMARYYVSETLDYQGELSTKSLDQIHTRDVFEAWKNSDLIAERVIRNCIELWGMTVANLVSLFNPEKIIFGGGVFGPAAQFLPDIYEYAALWAQPISIREVKLEVSLLGGDAGLIGAGRLARN